MLYRNAGSCITSDAVLSAIREGADASNVACAAGGPWEAVFMPLEVRRDHRQEAAIRLYAALSGQERRD